MPKIIIETDGVNLHVYTDTDAQVEVFDLAELRQDHQDDPNHLNKELEKVEKELLHKTTGLKQVYP